MPNMRPSSPSHDNQGASVGVGVAQVMIAGKGFEVGHPTNEPVKDSRHVQQPEDVPDSTFGLRVPWAA
jgi:hypothetical protein